MDARTAWETCRLRRRGGTAVTSLGDVLARFSEGAASPRASWAPEAAPAEEEEDEEMERVMPTPLPHLPAQAAPRVHAASAIFEGAAASAVEVLATELYRSAASEPALRSHVALELVEDLRDNMRQQGRYHVETY